MTRPYRRRGGLVMPDNMDHPSVPYVPPEVIAEEAAKLRANWDEKKHRARAGLPLEEFVEVTRAPDFTHRNGKDQLGG